MEFFLNYPEHDLFFLAKNEALKLGTIPVQLSNMKKNLYIIAMALFMLLVGFASTKAYRNNQHAHTKAHESIYHANQLEKGLYIP